MRDQKYAYEFMAFEDKILQPFPPSATGSTPCSWSSHRRATTSCGDRRPRLRQYCICGR
jgi:hypothetical protein